MRRRRYRIIEHINNADLVRGFARNKVRVVIKFRIPVSVEVNLKAHFTTL